MLPELVELILEFHEPKCTLTFNDGLAITLYWSYSNDMLKKVLGVRGPVMRIVHSSLGDFFKHASC